MSEDSTKILMRSERNPLLVPDSVNITMDRNVFTFEHAKKSMSYTVHKDVSVTYVDNKLSFALVNPKSRSQVTTARSRMRNIIEGLTTGYKITLLLVGVGYKAKLEGKKLVLNLGKSHQDEYLVPENVEVSMIKQTTIVLESHDKELIGSVAAEIKRFRPVEHDKYKGKGIRLENQVISLKEVKKS